MAISVASEADRNQLRLRLTLYVAGRPIDGRALVLTGRVANTRVVKRLDMGVSTRVLIQRLWTCSLTVSQYDLLPDGR